MKLQQKLILLFLLIFLGRCLFSFSIGLIDDEAYHWSWSKEIAWSYFDHPAMIAWLEWITTHLFGDTVFAVRLPALLCFGGSSFLLWKITEDMFDRESALYAVMLILFSPFFGFGGYVSSPEQPFILCWMLAVFVFWKYASNQWSAKKSWLLLGLVMGLGIHSKFIIATLAFGFGAFMLVDSKKRRDFLTAWPWIGLGIATVMALPVFIWNTQHDWPAFKYQFHDRHQGGDLSLQRWIGFFLAQLILLAPPVYFLTAKAWGRSALRRQELPWRFLFCLTAPSLLIFYVQPLFADYKPHWSGAAYLTLFVGAGFLWSTSIHKKTYTRLILLFLIPLNLLIYAPFLYPWLPKASRYFFPQNEWHTTSDLSNEFHGWEELGQRLIQKQNEILAATGQKPFLASHRYETTAQTYWGAKQKTFTLAHTVSHYTVMQQAELDQLLGHDALFITTEKYPGDPMKHAKWNSCTPEKFETYREDELSRQFTIWSCQNFQGIL